MRYGVNYLSQFMTVAHRTICELERAATMRAKEVNLFGVFPGQNTVDVITTDPKDLSNLINRVPAFRQSPGLIDLPL